MKYIITILFSAFIWLILVIWNLDLKEANKEFKDGIKNL
jgi:hypothetical protein